MDPERWARIDAIFHQAVDVPAEQRAAFLDRTCEGDAGLREAIQELLDEDARRTSLLDQDVAQVAHNLLSTPPDGPLPFTRIGRYTITKRLGEGGMGVVFLAEREDLGSRVAIKILRDAWVSPARRGRFVSEQRTLAQLNHPSIAHIYDADALPDGTPWFAMEFVDGQSLTTYCRARSLGLGDRLRLFRQVCDAVQHAHVRLIVHRDLKPSNILVTPDGTVKLLDFGIAKHLESLDSAGEETRTVLRLMTPAYASPEQMRGERAGIQTDVYALGVILYELLAGRRPFDLADRTPAEAEAIIERTAERPSVASRALPEPLSVRGSAWADLDVLCLTAMHRDPARRYATVDALARDVDRFLKSAPLEARGDSLRYRTGKFARRNWKALAAGAAAVAALIAVAGFYTVRLAAARDAAVAEAARTQRVQRFMLNLFEGGSKDVGPAADLRVLTFVDRGAKQAQSLDGDPAIQAELYQTLGSIYQRLGKYAEADSFLNKSLDRHRMVSGEGSVDTAAGLVTLGLLRADEAKLEESEKLVRDGLARLRAKLPPAHPQVANALVALGKVLRERGLYEQAVPPLEQAIDVYSARPDSTADLADAMTALAETHFYAGRLDLSDSLNTRVLEIDRRLYGNAHPHVADDLINLGASQTNRGNPVEAGRFYRDAVDIFERWYGRDHPETASAMTALAQSLVPQGKFDEASGLLRQALATQRHFYGESHPRVAFVFNELGLVAMRRKNLDEAESSFAQALTIYDATYHGKHLRVGIAQANLASVYLAREQYDRAAALFRKAIALYGELLPADHLNIGIAEGKLGHTLVLQGHLQDAEPHLLKADAILTKQGNANSTWAQTARDDLAKIRAAGKDRSARLQPDSR
jgi:serine/threonine-protein kinase